MELHAGAGGAALVLPLSAVSVSVSSLNRIIRVLNAYFWCSFSFSLGTFVCGHVGQDSMDWAAMLLRMYERWAHRHQFECTMFV